MIKRTAALLGALALMMILSACSRDSARTDNDAHRETLSRQETKSVSTAVVHTSQGNPHRLLIAYFTYPDNTEAKEVHSTEYDVMTSASLNVKDGEIIGNNGLIAKEMAKETGGDMFSILAATPYSADYDALVRDEKAASANQEERQLKSHVGDMSGYDTIVLIYPIWWDTLPPPVKSFLTENDLSGKTVYAVASSGDSDFDDTVESIQNLEPDAAVRQAFVLRHEDMGDVRPVVQQWLRNVDFMK